MSTLLTELKKFKTLFCSVGILFFALSVILQYFYIHRMMQDVLILII